MSAHLHELARRFREAQEQSDRAWSQWELTGYANVALRDAFVEARRHLELARVAFAYAALAEIDNENKAL